MTQARPSRDAAHFDRIYAGSGDPWQFKSSAYEREKYAATMAALPSRRFRAALEVGCSIGELTRLLAKRCDGVHGVDIAAAPLVTAQARCDDLPQVRFTQLKTPAQWPLGQYDLIMLSEVLYFLSMEDISAMAARVCRTLTPSGVVMLVNWLGTTDDPTSGDDAAEAFIDATAADLRVDLQQRHEKYRIDRLCRRPG
jgi:2-polyprenyl-3-methyl-5-hydroxy-6-metoxy-1,4-benzoquinol methylase